MNRRFPFRLMAVILLALIAVDLAAIHTCALHIEAANAAGRGSGPLLQPPGTSHPPVLLHPDHCVCHSPVIASGAPAGLAAPALPVSSLFDLASRRPHDTPSPLDHPPQLHA